MCVGLAYLKRHSGRDHKEEEDTESPNIDSRARVGVVMEEFGGGVRRRSAKCCQQMALLFGAINDPCRESEITKTNPVSR